MKSPLLRSSASNLPWPHRGVFPCLHRFHGSTLSRGQIPAAGQTQTSSLIGRDKEDDLWVFWFQAKPSLSCVVQGFPTKRFCMCFVHAVWTAPYAGCTSHDQHCSQATVNSATGRRKSTNQILWPSSAPATLLWVGRSSMWNPCVRVKESKCTKWAWI